MFWSSSSNNLCLTGWKKNRGWGKSWPLQHCILNYNVKKEYFFFCNHNDKYFLFLWLPFTNKIWKQHHLHPPTLYHWIIYVIQLKYLLQNVLDICMSKHSNSNFRRTNLRMATTFKVETQVCKFHLRNNCRALAPID